jgi:hypothetical protein
MGCDDVYFNLFVGDKYYITDDNGVIALDPRLERLKNIVLMFISEGSKKFFIPLRDHNLDILV